MNYKLAVIPGDGIGPEVVGADLKRPWTRSEKIRTHIRIHKGAGRRLRHRREGRMPAAGNHRYCKASDAVLLGAVGGWKWDTLPGSNVRNGASRPEKGTRTLCKPRPALLFEQLADACPLKPEIVEGGLDIVVVSELTGGIYFGEKGTKDTDLGPAAYDVEQYAEEEVRRIAEVAFDMAMKRNKKVTSVDKANVLESSRLWRRVVAEVG